MRSRWIGILFTLLFLLFLIFAARRIAAPLLDFHLFQLETKLIYIILASVVFGGLLLFLMVVFFPPWTSRETNRAPLSSIRAAVWPGLLEAQIALDLGEIDRGIQLLGSVEEAETGYWYSRKLIGDRLAESGDWAEAATEYRKALKRATGRERALIFLSLGNVYENKDEIDEAKDLYAQGLQIAPRSPELVSRLRGLAVRNQDWQDAMTWQEKMEQEFPGDSETPHEANWKIGIRYELARDACRSGSFKTSQALLKYVFRLTDYFTPAYLLQGEIQEQQQNPLAGFRCYEQGFRMTQNPALLKKIGESLLLQNQPAKAVEFLRDVVRNNPGDPRIAFCLGDLYRKLEMSPDAIKVFEGIRQKHPDWALNNSTLAELYYRSGQHERSLEIYRFIVDGAEGFSLFPWQCYQCNTMYIEYTGFCMICTTWNSINLNQNKAGSRDFGYERSTALPL
jgi:tetratricopeptide (TPR) repeat protein/uncharacterized integral membrane protein